MNSNDKSLVVSQNNQINELFQKLNTQYIPLKQKEKKEIDIGRIKQRPHKIGDYPGSIYIELPLEIKDHLFNVTSEFLTDFKQIQNPHISLCKEFTLREHQIHLFVQEVRKRTKCFDSFEVRFGQFKTLFNPEKNTQFLSIQIINDEVNRLIDIIDEVMTNFNLDVYYKERLIHTSLYYRTEHFDQLNELKQMDLSSESYKVITIKISIGEMVYTAVLKNN